MKQMGCAFEKDVMIAARLQHWTDSLRKHASTCPVCGETTRVNQWMQAYSRELESRPLPNHRLIWLRAHYARRQERLSTIDIVALGGMWGMGVAGFVGLLFWQLPHFVSGALEMTGRSFPDLGNLLFQSTSLAVTVAVVIMVWVLTRDSFIAKR